MPTDLWRLALFVDDQAAIKVAAAIYSLPKRHRRDIDRISSLSGVNQDVGGIISRLEVAGMLQSVPPQPLLDIIEGWVSKNLDKLE